ncbi:MAG: PP2C family protein-serine/threonine phosphatase [Muribaculaceae bacterium]|nr:protein phosphatase 2C domain-containing protein [Muribaculaceae bacterium]
MKITLRQAYSFCQLGKRKNQEDARYPDENKPSASQRTFVVCDGVGGQDKGEVASQTVAEAMGRYMERVDLNERFLDSEFALLLDQTYRALFRRMDDDTREMATTMTFVTFHAGGVTCAHMGDSRIYQVRPGKGVIYRSDDHSLVNALVHAGCITPEEAINHPKSNVITRCLTWVEPGEERPGATVMVLNDVEPGDFFFLCSDGVLHCVSDERLTEILSDSSTDDRQKIQLIAELSKESTDNNTAYLIPVDSVKYDNTDEEPQIIPRPVGGDDTDGDVSCSTEPIKKPMPEAHDVEPAVSVVSKISSKISNLIHRLIH